MSRLLLDEQPLVILPKLAVVIGLNEAIVLQQLHYWVEKSKNEKDGKYWVYNTLAEWREQFPFWSKNTIIRTFEKLEQDKLIETGVFNRNKSDRTKWYTINYKTLDACYNSFTQIGNMDLPKKSKPFTQNENMDNPNWEHGSSTQNGQLVNQRLPKNPTKTTTENNIPLQIKNLRQRYSESQLKLIDNYFDMLKHTRVSAKISDSVVLSIYEKWDKHPQICVEYGVKVHFENSAYHSKKEQYTLGIVRNTTAEEAAEKLNTRKGGSANARDREVDELTSEYDFGF